MKLKKVLKNAAVAVLGRDPRVLAGALLSHLFPDRRTSLIASFYTDRRSDFVSRMIRHKINFDYYRLDDSRSREWNVRAVWGEGDAGLKWHLENERRAAEDFESHMRFKLVFLRMLKEYLRENRFETLVEIGTGTGLFLDYMCGEMADVSGAPTRYVGLDLSTASIALARKRNTRPNVSYVAVTDTEAYIRNTCGSSTLFVALGTLEFFRDGELLRFLDLIRSLPGAALALCEPVNMDLDTEKVAKPRGNLMYSHNYPWVLKNAGFNIRRLQRLPISETDPHYQNVLLVASSS